ncbi:hypothetical protein NBRC116493_17700 [Aurantivibrio infirmus]
MIIAVMRTNKNIITVILKDDAATSKLLSSFQNADVFINANSKIVEKNNFLSMLRKRRLINLKLPTKNIIEGRKKRR